MHGLASRYIALLILSFLVLLKCHVHNTFCYIITTLCDCTQLYRSREYSPLHIHILLLSPPNQHWTMCFVCNIVCVHAGTCALMHVYVCVCLCVHMCVHTHTYTQCVYVCVCVHMYISFIIRSNRARLIVVCLMYKNISLVTVHTVTMT